MSRADPHANAAGHAPEDEAVKWIARIRSDNCSGQDWDAFCAWRGENPENDATFTRYMEKWAALDDLGEESEIVRLRLEAMAIEPESSRRPFWLMPLAASVVLMLGTGLVTLTLWGSGAIEREQGRQIAATAPAGESIANSEPSERAMQDALAEERFVQSYRSAVGQRSKVDLPDGSTIELNTDTMIEVNFTPQRREFRLVRGEALFDVEPDASRPFIVNSHDDRVIALGTVFSVRKVGEDIVVSLFEGEVQVDRLADLRPGARPAQSIRLDAGQQLSTAALGDFNIRPLDGEKELDWRSGRLVFDDDRLVDVVTELNRYSVRKLALGDPELGQLRVSGTFRTGSADAFAAALAIALPVSVTSEREGGKIVLYSAE